MAIPFPPARALVTAKDAPRLWLNLAIQLREFRRLDQKERRLATLPPFCSLPTRSIQELAQLLDEITMAAGQSWTVGSPPREWYLVTEGQIAVSPIQGTDPVRRRSQLTVLTPCRLLLVNVRVLDRVKTLAPRLGPLLESADGYVAYLDGSEPVRIPSALE